jgi:hypothetical protein
MRSFSYLPVEVSGSTLGAARSAPVRKEEEGGRLGREDGLGRPRGRGPVGEGRKKNGRLEKKNGPWMGRK